MTEQAYAYPVNQLLEYGEPNSKIPDYLSLGFTEKDIPELMRMMQDSFIYDKNNEKDMRWAAPIHAWRVLAQLRAEVAIPVFLSLLYEIDDHDNDWVAEEFPQMLAMIGPASLPMTYEYLNDDTHGLYARITAANILENIGNTYPEHRVTIVDYLTQILTRYLELDMVLNAFLISYLVDLQALESLPIIRQAFASNNVDWQVMGDLEEVEIELGVRTERSTPKPNYSVYPSSRTESSEKKSNHSFYNEPYSTTDKTPYIAPIKIGRNEPCPCGSGKKYKKCCLNS